MRHLVYVDPFDAKVHSLTLSKFQKILVIGLPSRTDHRDSMSDLRVEYVDGVSSVDNRTLPPGGIERKLSQGSIFGWRAHMNVLRM
jgi:hypothetical protein